QGGDDHGGGKDAHGRHGGRDLPVGRGGDLDQARIAAGLAITAGHAGIMLFANTLGIFEAMTTANYFSDWADLTRVVRGATTAAAAPLASAHLERLAPEAQPTSPQPRQPGLELVAEAARAAE